MTLLQHLRSFIARTFLSAYAGPGQTAGAPIVQPPADFKPTAPPSKGAEDEDEDEDEDPEAGEADPEGGEREAPRAEDEDEDDNEDEGDGQDEPDADADANGDDDEDEDDDDDVEDYRDNLRAQLAATQKASGNPYDARFDVDAVRLAPKTRTDLLEKLTPKDADDDEKAGAAAIVDGIELAAKEIALGLLGGYHNAAVVPFRKNLDTAQGRAALEREGEQVAKKNPELWDDAVQRRIVAELDKLDAEFGPSARQHLQVKKLLRLVPMKMRMAARARVEKARGKPVGKRKEPREPTEDEQREAALGASSAPRNSNSKGVPTRKTQPKGDSEDRRALARHLQGGRRVPFF